MSVILNTLHFRDQFQKKVEIKIINRPIMKQEELDDNLKDVQETLKNIIDIEAAHPIGE